MNFLLVREEIETKLLLIRVSSLQGNVWALIECSP